MTFTTTTIDPQIAADLYDNDVPGDYTARGWTYFGKQHIRTSRWYEEYYLVVRDNEYRFWGLVFQEGLTEEQEMDLPWETTEDPLPLVRLYPHEVTTVEYRTVA